MPCAAMETKHCFLRLPYVDWDKLPSEIMLVMESACCGHVYMSSSSIIEAVLYHFVTKSRQNIGPLRGHVYRTIVV